MYAALPGRFTINTAVFNISYVTCHMLVYLDLLPSVPSIFYCLISLRRVVNAGVYIRETSFPSFAALMNLVFTSSEKFQSVNFAIIGKSLPGLFSLALCALSIFLMIIPWSLFSTFFLISFANMIFV